MKQQHLGVRGTERNYISEATSHCFSAQHLLNHFYSLPPNFFFSSADIIFSLYSCGLKVSKLIKKPITRRKKKIKPKTVQSSRLKLQHIRCCFTRNSDVFFRKSKCSQQSQHFFQNNLFPSTNQLLDSTVYLSHQSFRYTFELQTSKHSNAKVMNTL